MAMFLYALGVLPIILQLKHHQQDVESLSRISERLQAWYADDSAKAAFFEAIRDFFRELCRIGPPLGYFPEPDKSILVYRYLGGYLGEGKEDFVTEKVMEWVESVRRFIPLVRRNPQA
eukprot:708873-Ditylum_brightwellii.AAC.1